MHVDCTCVLLSGPGDKLHLATTQKTQSAPARQGSQGGGADSVVANPVDGPGHPLALCLVGTVCTPRDQLIHPPRNNLHPQ